MNSDRDTRCRVGCPIRRSRDHRSLASPPGFSQRATSFIASQCQGIHQMPFFACSPVSPTEETAPPPRTGSNPVPANLSPRKRGAGTESPRKRGPIAASRMKTLLEQTPSLSNAGLSASVTSSTLSSPFNQPQRRGCPRRLFCASPNAPARPQMVPRRRSAGLAAGEASPSRWWR
jgi:hypothetical protein